MSRETDNSSPGSQGHGGGAAYPSGTPPYGTPAPGAASEAGTDAGRQAPDAPAEERRTETTLTTRVRINIPGSRPIPPLVMRTPMSDLTEAAKGAGGATASAEPAGEGAGHPADGPAGGSGQGHSGDSGSDAADVPAQEPTSDWFAPRKAASPRGGTPPGGRTPGASSGSGDPFGAGDPLGDDSTGSVRRPGSGFGSDGGSGFDGDTGTGTGSGFDTGSRSAFDTGSGSAFDSGSFETGSFGTGSFDTGSFGTGTSSGTLGTDPFGPDPFGTEGSGLGLGLGTGASSGTLGTEPSEHGQSGPGDPFGGGPFTDRSEFSGFAEHPDANGAGGTGGDGQGGGSPEAGPRSPGGIDPKSLAGPDSRSGLYDLFGESEPEGPGGERSSSTFDVQADGPGGSGGPGGPSGSDRSSGTFDVTGAVASGPLGASGGPRASDLSYFPDDPASGPGGAAPDATGGRSTLPRRPTGPTGGPVTGDSRLGSGERTAEIPTGLLGDEQGPGGPRPRMSDDTAVLTPQRPAPDPSGPDDNVSGHTVTSGIRVVPSPQNSPFGGTAQEAEGAGVPHTPPKLPDPEPRSTSAAPAARKKGRSKLVLLSVLVVVAAGGVYGAGLLVNHADVPKGTTVLGVDIGGGTRDEAGKKLDAAFSDRVNKPLTLSVNGKSIAFRPDQSGLALDTDATVQAAAGSDYNPVTVVGSLFGGKRVVEPVMPVDQEKLNAALQGAAGGAGSAADGTIRFDQGKAVAVYGKAGKAIDVAKSSKAVEAAYRTEIETGHGSPVQVPLTERHPTVSNAEVDRMMREFAQPAMSGIVTIKAGSASIPFGPEKSLPQILGVQAVDGKLIDTYDRAALKKLYGTTFDGVLITRANGKKTPITPEDVIGVMRKALLGKTPAERVGVIDTNPN
ncbi:hypothetical protein [Streptomyces sp. TS71-3]|uniref:hypothetical protein n=1 Tax=Streptomyces sp. TS71-3 TaxID=2733862 RepID=UPI001B0998AB|nr:hypothetical protein [Streptomyces sp. TS71-3]GHJ35771.1 hypothetical protein Sm713_13800 [Streptomyces sp. TS71-3]